MPLNAPPPSPAVPGVLRPCSGGMSDGNSHASHLSPAAIAARCRATARNRTRSGDLLRRLSGHVPRRSPGRLAPGPGDVPGRLPVSRAGRWLALTWLVLICATGIGTAALASSRTPAAATAKDRQVLIVPTATVRTGHLDAAQVAALGRMHLQLADLRLGHAEQRRDLGRDGRWIVIQRAGSELVAVSVAAGHRSYSLWTIGGVIGLAALAGLLAAAAATGPGSAGAEDDDQDDPVEDLADGYDLRADPDTMPLIIPPITD